MTNKVQDLFSIVWDVTVALASSFVILIVLLIFLVFVYVPWVHDYRMDTFETSMQEIPLPPGTRIVVTSQRFGLLWGNSNHCDANVVGLMQTRMSQYDVAVLFEQPADLDWPLSDEFTHVQPVKTVGDKLYYLSDTRLDPKRQEQPYFNKIKPSFFSMLESSEVEQITALLATHHRTSEYEYYVLIARDQGVSSFDMYDRRCN